MNTAVARQEEGQVVVADETRSGARAVLLELAAKLDDLAEKYAAEASAGWKGNESLAFVAHRLTARDAFRMAAGLAKDRATKISAIIPPASGV